MTDDNSHASSVAAQLRAAAEDDDAPEEARKLARERLEEREADGSEEGETA